MTNTKQTIILLCLLFCFQKLLSQDKKEEKKVTVEFSGNMQGSFRYFPNEGLSTQQKETYFSGAFQPELYIEWDKGNQIFQATGFGRLDQHDDERTHVDIRELYYQRVFKNWEFSIGLKKIFWGVTEANHVVDVINQADLLEGFDLEQKLGQPMLHFSFLPSWGTIDIIYMPYFRELRFPGVKGRLRPPDVEIDYDATIYESTNEEFNQSMAIRWAHSVGVFDFGLSHFYGTSRTPFFGINPQNASFFLIYEQINQTGLDLQASTGSMLWKFEGIHRESKRKTITSMSMGGEFTFGNIFSSGIDIGLLAEYQYDDRGIELINGLNNDLFAGLRFAFNDKQSTDILGGVTSDLDDGTKIYFMEASRRVGDSWKVSIELFAYDNIDPDSFLYLLRKDSYGQFTLFKYF